MSVAEAAPSGRIRRVWIPCSECGGRREVSLESRSRIERGLQANVCDFCSALARAPVTEASMGFWLIAYGADRGQVRALTASVYVQEHGLPMGLRAMLDDMRPKR